MPCTQTYTYTTVHHVQRLQFSIVSFDIRLTIYEKEKVKYEDRKKQQQQYTPAACSRLAVIQFGNQRDIALV